MPQNWNLLKAIQFFSYPIFRCWCRHRDIVHSAPSARASKAVRSGIGSGTGAFVEGDFTMRHGMTTWSRSGKNMKNRATIGRFRFVSQISFWTIFGCYGRDSSLMSVRCLQKRQGSYFIQMIEDVYILWHGGYFPSWQAIFPSSLISFLLSHWVSNAAFLTSIS